MKTGDTEPNVLDLTKSMQVEFKKSAFGGNAAGKKLSPAHAVNIFSNVVDVVGKKLYYRFVNDQISAWIDLPDKIFKRTDNTIVIAVNVEMVCISRSNDRYLRKETKE
jgi:hypothetical protein